MSRIINNGWLSSLDKDILNQKLAEKAKAYEEKRKFLDDLQETKGQPFKKFKKNMIRQEKNKKASTNTKNENSQHMLGGRKTIICELLGTGMILVMPVPLLSVHPRE